MLFREDFNYRKLNMKEWFIKKGYPESVIEQEMKKMFAFLSKVKNLKKLKREYHLL